MTTIEIVPSILPHAKELSLTLREKDKREAEALGLYPHRGVFFAYRHACYRRTALIDGKVAAMWGLHGELLGSIGHPYFLTGTEVEKISPLMFTRVYKNEVEVMKTFFPVLENYVDASYVEAVRLLNMAGFTVSDPHTTDKGDVFLKYRMEVL